VAKPRSEDDFGDLESESSRARISAITGGGTLQPSGSQLDMQNVSRPSIAASLSGPLGELGIAMDEENTPLAGVESSPVRSVLREDSRRPNSQNIVQGTSTLPIAAGQFGTPGGIGNTIQPVPERLTASNLQQHTHGSSQNMPSIPHDDSSQTSADTKTIVERNADFAHFTIEERYYRACECYDDCRSSSCLCATSGTLCSMDCHCNINTSDDQRWGGCFNYLKQIQVPFLREHYFGSVTYRAIDFHGCFASRVLAFMSGDLVSLPYKVVHKSPISGSSRAQK